MWIDWVIIFTYRIDDFLVFYFGTVSSLSVYQLSIRGSRNTGFPLLLLLFEKILFVKLAVVFLSILNFLF